MSIPNNNDRPTLEAVLANMTPEERAVIEANMRAKRQVSLSWRVSPKGAISIYGLNGRFPVTLYANQFERFVDVTEAISEWAETEPFHVYDLTDSKTAKSFEKIDVADCPHLEVLAENELGEPTKVRSSLAKRD